MTIHRAPARRSIAWNYAGIAVMVAALVAVLLIGLGL